ncbi:MAG TPA: histidine kinase [Terrimicrobiaceae bacterium]|nr:histidine kinase [Terrimicrobiaceae bacterium]
MNATARDPSSSEAGGIWAQIPVFWRFQLGGWLAFTVFSFPLKWVVLESVPGSVLISLYRDGLGFILTLGMRGIYRRVYRRKPRPLTVALVVAVSLAGGGVLTLFSFAFHDLFDFEEEKIFTQSMVFAVFYFRTGLCAGWSLLYFGIKLMRDSMQRDLRLALAEAGRQRAELQLLRAQMNPHFLYNALNTITAEIGKPGQHLKALVRSLAKYLRYSLETRNDERVPLGQEFDAVTSYLAVEKARFREKLEVESEIAPDARNALVPGIVIQPLVENAIKYGRKTSPRPLKVRLIVSKHGPSGVQIEVSNTGKWVEPDPADNVGGIGLQNLKERLKLLYPESHSLQISADSGWVIVQIRIAEP